MEVIRRRKLCRYMMRAKPDKVIRKLKKMDFKNTKLKHYNCSNSPTKCHPYQDNINFVHVLSDTMDITFSIVYYLKENLDDFFFNTEPEATTENLQLRYKRAVFAINRFIREVGYAEDRRIVANYTYMLEPHFILMKDKKLNWEVVPCGGYNGSLNKLIAKASENLRLNQSKHEKRIHLNKLKVFTALKELEECDL